jgi:hypothetical protein
MAEYGKALIAISKGTAGTESLGRTVRAKGLPVILMNVKSDSEADVLLATVVASTREACGQSSRRLIVW